LIDENYLGLEKLLKKLYFHLLLIVLTDYLFKFF